MNVFGFFFNDSDGHKEEEIFCTDVKDEDRNKDEKTEDEDKKDEDKDDEDEKDDNKDEKDEDKDDEEDNIEVEKGNCKTEDLTEEAKDEDDKEDEDDEENDDEEEEEEKELVDQLKCLRERCNVSCRTFQCKLDTCNERVNSKYATTENCVEELMDLVHCVDDCARKNLFKMLK